jgi:hypothetical protein
MREISFEETDWSAPAIEKTNAARALINKVRGQLTILGGPLVRGETLGDPLAAGLH